MQISINSHDCKTQLESLTHNLSTYKVVNRLDCYTFSLRKVTHLR